ncbi:MAG: hypothetical protein KC550_01430 [Nanoarchaeota archaeon]|nr:hypothetical protein [Nanoarchaeota archaeon]
MLKKILLLFLIIFMLDFGFATLQRDCYDVLRNNYPYTDFIETNMVWNPILNMSVPVTTDNIPYSDYSSGMSTLKEFSSPYLGIDFDTPVVYVKFFNYGTSTTLRVNPYPQYSEFNFYEMYVEDPANFGLQFAGCGVLKLDPIGFYNFNNIYSWDFGSYDSNTIDINQDTFIGKFRVFENDIRARDDNGNLFIEWNNYRVYYDNSTALYFNQAELLNSYKNAINSFLGGNSGAFADYREGAILSGKDWAQYLRGYSNYVNAGYISGIGDGTLPTPFVQPAPFQVTFFNLSSVVGISDMNTLIDIINNQYAELAFYGLHAGYVPITHIPSDSLIEKSKFEEIDTKVRTLFNIIDRAGFHRDPEIEILVSDETIQAFRDNINIYLSEKLCDVPDFTCGTWGACTGLVGGPGITNRAVTRNRNCVNYNPLPATTCKWAIHTTGATYRSTNTCSYNTLRDDTYRDLFTLLVTDTCGIYTVDKWIGHTTVGATNLGATDTCYSGGGDDGGGN